MNKWNLTIVLTALLGLSACSNNSGRSSTTSNGNGGSSNTNNGNSQTSFSKNYVVQLTATTSLAKAAEIKKTFAIDEGYENVMISTVTINSKKIHRVQMGPYTNKVAAQSRLEKLKLRYRKNQYVNNAVVKTISKLN